MLKLLILNDEKWTEEYRSVPRAALMKLLEDALKSCDPAFKVEVIGLAKDVLAQVKRGGVHTVIVASGDKRDMRASVEFWKQNYPHVKFILLTDFVPDSIAPPRVITLKKSWVTPEVIQEAVFD